MGPPIYIGGNASTDANSVCYQAASMGPPIYIGGNPRRTAPRPASGTCFNGATDLYRWKPSMSSRPKPRKPSFNGATDLYRWKPSVARAAISSVDALQWGHRFISVETYCYSAGYSARLVASMGPPIYIGGNTMLNRPNLGR